MADEGGPGGPRELQPDLERGEDEGFGGSQQGLGANSDLRMTLLDGAHKDGGNKDGSHKDDGHKDGSHMDGDHKDGSHKDSSHKDGSHMDGDHKDGSHKDNSHKDDDHKDGTYKDGSHRMAATIRIGYKDGSYKDGSVRVLVDDPTDADDYSTIAEGTPKLINYKKGLTTNRSRVEETLHFQQQQQLENRIALLTWKPRCEDKNHYHGVPHEAGKTILIFVSVIMMVFVISIVMMAW